MRAILLTTFLTIVLILTACGHGGAETRPVPALAPVAEREHLRKLPFDGAHNFRDLGGYLTEDGRRVRWGLIYRSDTLADLSAEDQRYLQRLGITQVVDFRSRLEREQEPDRLPAGVAAILRPIEVAETGEGNLRQLFEDPSQLENFDFENFLVKANRLLITKFTPVYRQWLQDAAHFERPAVFHCTAGKDRAGLAAALLLLSLGVSREDVMRDYLLTREYTDAHVESQLRKIRWASLWRFDAEKIRPLLSVERRYLEAAFETIEREYGSLEGYLREALGVDDALRERLRTRYLEG